MQLAQPTRGAVGLIVYFLDPIRLAVDQELPFGWLQDQQVVRPILVIEGYPADLDGPLKAISAPEEEDGGGNGRH